MKRLGSSDSVGAFISISPTTSPAGDRSPGSNSKNMYSREFQSMLDSLDHEEGSVEESGLLVSEKKRRLSVDQVKALEKNFEVENKLEPERKVKLAHELGLQPRQVAVWFQNRRARWKTKQLESEYGILKAKYDALKLNYDSLKQNNESLVKEIRELKAKFGEENTDSHVCVKEETVIQPELDEEGVVLTDQEQPLILGSLNDQTETEDFNFESFNRSSGIIVFEASLLTEQLRDGSSTDSDSSVIFNEDNSNKLITSPLYRCSSSPVSATSMNNNTCFEFTKTTSSSVNAHFVKMEEHDFFSGHEEACNFFNDEQAPALHWYCPDQWN